MQTVFAAYAANGEQPVHEKVCSSLLDVLCLCSALLDVHFLCPCCECAAKIGADGQLDACQSDA